MSEFDNIYLSDKQYLDLLYKIRRELDEVSEVVAYNSEATGNKETEVNVGLCNDLHTTEATALFPDDFPARRAMKYRKQEHRCPLDTRTLEDLKTDSNGCFWTCAVFQYSLRNMAEIKRRYDVALREAEGCIV